MCKYSFHFFDLFSPSIRFFFYFSSWFLFLSSKKVFVHGRYNFFSIWSSKEMKISNHFAWPFCCFIRYSKDKVVITWSWLAEVEFCTVLLGSRKCYKLFINYILQLHVKSFIPTNRDPFFVVPGSSLAGTKFSHVIASAHLNGIKL